MSTDGQQIDAQRTDITAQSADALSPVNHEQAVVCATDFGQARQVVTVFVRVLNEAHWQHPRPAVHGGGNVIHMGVAVLGLDLAHFDAEPFEVEPRVTVGRKLAGRNHYIVTR